MPDDTTRSINLTTISPAPTFVPKHALPDADLLDFDDEEWWDPFDREEWRVCQFEGFGFGD